MSVGSFTIERFGFFALLRERDTIRLVLRVYLSRPRMTPFRAEGRISYANLRRKKEKEIITPRVFTRRVKM